MVLLQTKLAVPPSRPEWVVRPQLLERLMAGLDRKLTLLSAPAGFGKTTLLAEWVARCRRPVAWLSLDPGDNDPARFLTYLVASVHAPGTEADDGATAPATLPGATTEDQLTIFLNQLEQAGPRIIVLDDYHLITAESVHAAVTFFIEHLPACVHLAIATRADPPLPVARLRARGRLSEVRAPDLAFTAEEAHAFLNQTMGLQLDTDAATRLRARTEGWIAGLQLAGLSLRGREDVAGFIAAFAGSNRYIFDFLVDEVLSRQPAEIQSFLLQTSVLSRLTGPLCKAVAGDQNPGEGQGMLATLEGANLFTVPLDDERRWYRYHHLFADCLQAQLHRTSPDLLPELHRRAAEWYADEGFGAEAIGHALQAGDNEQAADLIESVALDLLARSEHATVRRWLEALPAEVVEGHPSLCVYYGWTLLEAFEAAAGGWIDRPGDSDLPPHLRFLRAALQARLSWLHGEPGLTGPFVGDVIADSGPFQDADISDPQVRAYLSLYGHAQLAEALRLQGRLRRAVQTYEHALRSVEAVEPDSRILAALSFAEMGLGRLLYEQNDLDAADQHMARAIELARRGQNEQYESWVCMFLPAVRQAQGRGAEALELIDRAEASARRRGLPAEILWCAAQRVRLACTQGDLETISGWVESYRPAVDQEAGNGTALGYIEEFADAAYARGLLVLGRSEEAVHLTERLLDRVGATGQNGHTIELLILSARASKALGDRAKALASLEHALALAEPEGYIRVFADEGEPIAALLLAGRSHFANVSPAYVQQLLEAIGDRVGETATAPKPPLVEPLTTRELDVLRLLAQGLHNREVAGRLVVTVGTVKRHTGNIYGKLGVDNRTRAILKAQDLGLL
jgi:LuxR family maltose regulon positive regulatory protein